MSATHYRQEITPLTSDQRKALARRRTLARIRSLREEANRLERILNGQTR